MIGFSVLNNVFSKVIATGLVREIYHSVIIREDGTGQKKPSAPVSKKFVYVGIDDSKGFTCYCRAVTPLEFSKETALGGCNNSIIKTQSIHRLVFFNEGEKRSHDDLTGALIKSVLNIPQTKFLRAYTNAEDFLRQEQPTGTFNLSTNSYYAAIDFQLFLNLTGDNCSTEITCGIQNPFCL